VKKKTLAILLSLAMVLSLFPVSAFASDTTSGFSDMPSNWSTKALENAVSNGLLSGDNGKIMPNDNLTRAQMATVVNRAFGTTEKASLSSYTDVEANAWYYDDMAKAVQMKTFVGSGDKLNPATNITREEAFAVLIRAFKLSGADQSALDKFTDKALVSSWAKDAAASLISAGYVVGSNGKLNPKQNITRAEFAQIMDNLLKNYIKTAGTYTTDYTGNMMINVPNVILKNITITGDLIIGDGVGNGDVILDGVTVTGRTVIRGGGVNSIKIIGDSNLQNIIIARVDGEVRVYSQDGTQIGEVTVDHKYLDADSCVCADYATEELLSRYDSYDELPLRQDDYAQRLIITTSAVVEDFRFVDISFSGAAGEELQFIENEEQYSLDYFTPDNPFVVWVSFPGILPTRAISFVDENGTTRSFAIVMSGEDGSILLFEIQLSDS